MDGPGINEKIRFGYAKAAQKLGEPFDLYRWTSPIDPIDSANLIGSLPAVMTVDWEWMKANKPGNNIWYVLIDGQASSFPLSAEERDYLVGDAVYYIFSKEYQMPMQAMQCNRQITINRPTQSMAPGSNGYIDPQSSPTEIARNMPASVLLTNSGENSPMKLPSDTKQGTWTIQIPNDFSILVGDIVIDDLGQEYVVMIPEESEFGWRLRVQQVVNDG